MCVCICVYIVSLIPDSKHYMSHSCVALWTIESTVRVENGMTVCSLNDFIHRDCLARNKSHLLKLELLLYYQT